MLASYPDSNKSFYLSFAVIYGVTISPRGAIEIHRLFITDYLS